MADSLTSFIVLPLGSKSRITIKGASMTKDEDGVTIFDGANNAVAFFPNHSITGVFSQGAGTTSSRVRPKQK
jgi:hypothetical protein